MFADAIRCTHNGTGGATTLTLAAIDMESKKNVR